MEFLWHNLIKRVLPHSKLSPVVELLWSVCHVVTACAMLGKYWFKFWVPYPHFEPLNPGLCNVAGVNGLWCAIKQNQQARITFKSIEPAKWQCQGRPQSATANQIWFVCLQYICKIGTVHRITDRGDVRVQYSNNIRWTFHPGALTKVVYFYQWEMNTGSQHGLIS